MKNSSKKLFGVERPLAVWIITFIVSLFSLYTFVTGDNIIAAYSMLWVNFIFMWKFE